MLDCILAAQRIENIAKYVELRCNLGLVVSDPTRFHRIKDQLMDIKINNNDSLLDSVLPKYKRIMEKCITTADRLHSETWRGKKEKEAKKLLRVYKSEKANLLLRHKEISDEYNSVSEYIRGRMETPVDIVLISDTDGNFTATQLLAR